MDDLGLGVPWTNAHRALWAQLALEAYAKRFPSIDELSADPDVVLCDLLADLRHWADAWGVSYGEADELGAKHYESERETFCAGCLGPIFVTGNSGVWHHVSEESPDCIDHDSDADHTPILGE